MAITVRLEPEDAERLRELCRGAGCSQADWIARAVNEAPINFAKCYDMAMMELAFNFQPNEASSASGGAQQTPKS